MIANSGHNEHGGLYGGTPGDQTGGEWCVREWYSCPWSCVLRYPDANAAEEAAYLARRAAGNDHIGYNQLHRLSFWDALDATGTYDPADIDQDCDDDCSAGVTAIWKAVGKRLGIQALADLDPSTYTGNLRERFCDAGFGCITDASVRESDDFELPGDVLLRDNFHTALNLDVGSEMWDKWDPQPQAPGAGADEDTDEKIKEIEMNVASIIEAPEGRYLWNGQGLHEIQTDAELESVRGVYEKDGSTMPAYEFTKVGSVDRIRAVLAR